jgi:hypothetical protein
MDPGNGNPLRRIPLEFFSPASTALRAVPALRNRFRPYHYGERKLAMLHFLAIIFYKNS